MKLLKAGLAAAVLVSCGFGQTTKKHVAPCHNGDVNPSTFFFVGSVTFSKCVDGKWVPDADAKAKYDAMAVAYEKKEAEIKQHRIDLWNALRTRVVTDAEMKEILELGADIIPYKEGGGPIDWCGGGANVCSMPSNYQEVEQNRARNAEMVFNAALLNQFKMRTSEHSTAGVGWVAK